MARGPLPNPERRDEGRYRLELPLRWSDLDAQNHVNNVTYLEYLQEARVALLTEGEGAAMMRDGVVVVGHQIEYLRPIEYSEQPVRVDVTVSGVGASTFVYEYELSHDGQLCARARTVCCPYDFVVNRPRRLTAGEREYLCSFTGGEAVGPSGSLSFTPLPWPGVGHRPSVHELRVRWSDQDWFRHVNNVLYLDFLQEARIRFVHAGAGEHVWLIARQDIDYKAPMAFRREPYFVRSACSRVGTSSITLVADIVSSLEPGAVVHARSTCVVVCADRRGVPTPVPDALRAHLAAHPA